MYRARVMMHFLTTHRQSSCMAYGRHSPRFSWCCALHTSPVIHTFSCPFSPFFSGLGFLTFPWMEVFITEAASLNSGECWGAGSLKKTQRGIVVWFQTGCDRLHPAFLASCSVVGIFEEAARLGESGEAGYPTQLHQKSPLQDSLSNLLCRRGGPRAGKGWLGMCCRFSHGLPRPHRSNLFVVWVSYSSTPWRFSVRSSMQSLYIFHQILKILSETWFLMPEAEHLKFNSVWGLYV